MEVRYIHARKRSQFGKQCIFDAWGPIVDENILPDENLTKEYVARNPVHEAIQVSKQQAIHGIQTIGSTTRDTGMVHTEGGWPKEINHKDEEVTTRYRRRVEKDEIWPPKMKALSRPMERRVRQNNAVDIYENFFDDMIPTKLVLPLSIRTVNVYADPRTNPRPITHLSWSPDRGTRLAVSHCWTEFQKFDDPDPRSYLWDIENPNEPFATLEPSIPSVAIEFNPRDPSTLIGGLTSGQVCNWDIRTGNRPVQESHLLFSHRDPANQVLWINSKTNSEFFSASSDGSMKWWDARKIREPTETLVIDWNDPGPGDVVTAIGVSSMNYEPTMGTKFMIGLENGTVISGSRKGKNPSEKLALRFDSHYGPVVGLDRNPLNPKNFLTVGDWTARVWAEDTKEGCLFSTPFYKHFLTGGCWSRSRYSVFYVANMGGEVQVWDLMVGTKSPVGNLRLCEVGLSAIKSHEEGKFVAVGNVAGKVFLVEASEALTSNGKNDKVLTSSLMDRGSRYEKAIENRLKEVRLARRVVYEEEAEVATTERKKGKGREKKGKVGSGKVEYNEAKEGSKDGGKKERSGDERDKKKSKTKKGPVTDDPELLEAEIRYYATIQKEMERYAGIGGEQERPKGREGSGGPGKKKHEEKRDKESGRRDKKNMRKRRDKVGETGYVISKRRPETSEEDREDRPEGRESRAEGEVARETVNVSDTVDSEERKTPRRIRRKLRAPANWRSMEHCDESVVCDAKVCCADVYSRIGEKEDENDKGEGIESTELRRSRLFSGFPMPLEALKEFSPEEKRQIIRNKDAKPRILERDVLRAKRDLLEDEKRLRDAIEKSVHRTDHLPGPSMVPIPSTEDRIDRSIEGSSIDEDTRVNTEDDDHLPSEESVRRKKSSVIRDEKQADDDTCAPKIVPISVFDVVSSSMKKKFAPKMPRAPKLDFKYKIRAAVELIYPRISSVPPLKGGPLLPSLKIPSPPATPPPVIETRRKTKRTNHE